MKSVRAKILLITLIIAYVFGTIIVSTAMISLKNLNNDLSELAVTQADEIITQTTDTMDEHEREVANDFADASVKYFNQIFSDVHRHTESIAEYGNALYAKGSAPCDPDKRLGKVKDADPEAVRADYGALAPIREFIKYLPNYDTEHLENLDLYVVTESGMCLDGTFDELGDDYADLRNEIWYEGVKENGDVFWSGVFTGKVTGKVKVVCAAPIKDADGNIRAVAAGDIAVETFQSILENYDETQIISVLFFDKNGELMHATNDYEQTDKVKGYMDSGVDYVAEDNEIYAFRQMQETGWTIGLVLSKEKIQNAVTTVSDNIESNSAKTGEIIKSTISKANFGFLIATLIGVAVTFILTGILSSRLVKPIKELTNQVAIVGEGNLDSKITVRSKDEVGKLAEAFNKMTTDLDVYMNNLQRVTAEKERIGAELDVATHIQSSMLPCIFPPYPDRAEFDIYATMDPAKEVGGDFYDFFMVDDTHVAIVMADVSGKGVPAALFMVIGKTLIKDHTVPGRELTDVFYEVNNILCESNSEGLFITAFEGVLDLVTGEFVYVNAGHETPFISHAGGAFEEYPIKAGFVLAGMEDMKFKGGSVMLKPGDKVFTYTDGVPEATDANNELYGMDRLKEILATVGDKEPKEVLADVRSSVDAFVGEAPQFDDLTMLCLIYKQAMEKAE